MIARLVLINAGPFRGRHEIVLQPMAYAITARHENDPKRSNASGKSFLLEAIDIAITGRFKRSRSYDADGWITHGEREAEIVLTFEDGSEISRSRVRGKPTQIRFTRPGAGACAQDAAEDAILAYLALSPLDFSNAAYFEQKKMARLVDPELTDPADRMRIVSGWFGLGLAERADKRASEQGAEIEREIGPLLSRRAVLKEVHEAPREGIDIAQSEAEIAGLRTRATMIEEDEARARDVEQAREVLAEQAERIMRGKAKRAIIDASPTIDADAEAAEQIIAGLQGVRANLVGAVQTKKQVSLGQFDGACPVAPIACPVKDAINADRKASAAALEHARAACTKAEHALTAAREEHAPTLAKRREIDMLRREVESLRTEVRANVDAVHLASKIVEAAPSDAVDTERRELLAVEAREIADKIAELRGAVIAEKSARARKIEHDALIDKLDEKIASVMVRARRKHREVAIYRMAQRRVAERALAVVEDDANAMLADAGVELTVAARWERETKGWAKSCDECGAAFPTSAKIKTCERCGSARGPHVTQRLDFILSDRSGAFDDLGGIVMQLSAGAWLLDSRDSSWSTAMIDEPFGACDQKNRMGLAVQLLKLIGSGRRWRQALIVSHTPDTCAMYPGAIEIVVSEDGTRRIEVR